MIMEEEKEQEHISSVTGENNESNIEVEISSSCEKEKKKKKDDEFPIGMRVLAVDDDKVCLKLLESLLMACGYKVTVTHRALMAVQLLRENKDNYDLVITDVKMPDMDGFKLLEIVGLEMDLPVIMLSADSKESSVMKGIMHGARDYLLKPVRIEELKIIWKHVIRKPLHDPKKESDTTDRPNGEVKCEDHTSNLNGMLKEPKRERVDPDEEPSTQKRSRVVWTLELHTKFVNAVSQLGLDKAGPKKILALMDDPRLTRQNIASHLQKYRQAWKNNNLATGQQHPGASSSSGLSANIPNSSNFSFVNQDSNVGSSGSFRAEGYQHYRRTIQFNHAPWGRLPSNIPKIQCQQYSSTTQAVTPRFNQPSGYIESSLPRAFDMNSAPSSVTHPRFMLLQETISTLPDGGNTPPLFRRDSNAVFPLRHPEHGVNAENGVDLDMGSQIIHSQEPSPFTSSNNDPSGADLLNALGRFGRNI